MQLKLSDLAKMTEDERARALDDLVKEAMRPGVHPGIQARILAYEQKYGMSSQVMKEKFRTGEIADTADVSAWLMLLKR